MFNHLSIRRLGAAKTRQKPRNLACKLKNVENENESPNSDGNLFQSQLIKDMRSLARFSDLSYRLLRPWLFSRNTSIH